MVDQSGWPDHLQRGGRPETKGIPPLYLRVRHRGPPRQDSGPDLRHHSGCGPRGRSHEQGGLRDAGNDGPRRSGWRDNDFDLRGHLDPGAQKVSKIGYTRAKFGFDAETCGVIVSIDPQSADIAQGVDFRSTRIWTRLGPATRG